MSARAMTLAAVLVATVVLGPGPDARAGTPIVRACWTDNFLSLWVLDIAGFGSENFQIQGWRQSGTTCAGGANQLPVTGGLVLGTLTTFAVTTVGTGDACIPVFWQGVVNLDTAVITGNIFTPGSLSSPTFTLTPAECPPVVAGP